VANFHEARGPDVRKAPAQKLHDVKLGGAEACTAPWPGGDGDGTVREAHAATVGDGPVADRGGKGGDGGVAGGLGLRVHMPGDGPALGGNVLPQPGMAHLCLAERTGDGGAGFDRDQAVGTGGAPGCAVLGAAPARDDVVEVRVVLAVLAPGMAAPGAPRQLGADKALGGGQPLAGCGRGVAHGRGGQALGRADAGLEGRRHGEGPQEVRPGPLWVEVVGEPLLGFVLLPLGTVAVATGRVDAVLSPAGWALIQTMALVSAGAVWAGADDLAVDEGQLGGARQVRGGEGRADLTQGRHGRSPCMRPLRRS
jgi:hypothetical protein